MPPIGDLLPRVDVSALCPIACSEVAMVMDEQDETRLCEGPCKLFKPLLHTRIAMCHGYGRTRPARFRWNKQPAAQFQAAFCVKFHISSVEHHSGCGKGTESRTGNIVRVHRTCPLLPRHNRAVLRYKKYLSLPANRFCLCNRHANLVEGECTLETRGHQNATAHERDDVLD